MNLIHKGEFLSRDGHAWRCEIYSETATGAVGTLSFPAEEPLVIEWAESAKHEAIQSSNATLRIVSPGDRTYIGLYTVTAGGVRLDVYRDNALYWSGTLDPEFYEEPYERGENYEVSLTFSDFGILDRKKYSLSGVKSLWSILISAIEDSGVNFSDIDSSLVTTTANGNNILDEAHIDSANFYDEEGEPSSMWDALEGMLTPLALKLVQRGGKIWVYDLNGLSQSTDTPTVQWSGDAQTLSVDSVYNRIEIALSTYCADGDLMDAEEMWGDKPKTPTSLYNMWNKTEAIHEDAAYFTYPYQGHLTVEDGSSWENQKGFTLWLKDTADKAYFPGAAKCFRMVPLVEGESKEGVAVRWTGLGHTANGVTPKDYDVEYKGLGLSGMTTDINALGTGNACVNWNTSDTSEIAVFDDIRIPAADDPNDLLLRISVEGLFDWRYSPFIEEDETNVKKIANIIYMPIRLILQGDDGNTYEYRNDSVLDRSAGSVQGRVIERRDSLGTWVQYAEDSKPHAWVAFYETDLYGKETNKDGLYESSSAQSGFAENRQAFPFLTSKISAHAKKSIEGQDIPYPPVSGTLRISYLSQTWFSTKRSCRPYDSDYGNVNAFSWCEPMNLQVQFVLISAPSVKTIKAEMYDEELDTDDIVYKYDLLTDAKESLKISETCGTSPDTVLGARAILLGSDGKQLKTLTRAGRTAFAERLLAGTLCSQYGTRHTRITGEDYISAATAYKERISGDTIYYLLSETQDCISGVGEKTIIEVSPDQYDLDE